MVETAVETQFNGLEMLLASEGPHDELLAELKIKNCKYATAQHVAQARIAAGRENSVSEHGAYVAENFIYAPDGKIYITSADYSPILKHAKDATNAYLQDKEFCVPEKELKEIIKVANEDANKQVGERRVYILDRNEVRNGMDTSKLEQYDFARFLFKENTKAYGDWLSKLSVSNISVELVDAQYQTKQKWAFLSIKRKQAFARGFWILNVDNKSRLDGDWDLTYVGARGVREIQKC